MRVENVLVIGLGEIGAPLLEIVKGVYKGEGLDVEPRDITDPIDVMHVCYRYNRDFTRTTVNYVKRFNPKLTIIESTVLPFATSTIYKETNSPICHSPVRGRKKDGFKWAYFTYTKFIGPVKEEYGRMAEEYYRSLGFKPYVCDSPLETEFMKILNTTYYGLLIAWFQENHRICDRFGLNEDQIRDFYRTNERDSGGRHPRPVLNPGFITGHCVVPNVKLLQEIYPSPFAQVLLESNNKREQELQTLKNREKSEKHNTNHC